ncbi:CoA transferase [Micromonospora sp. AMSO12t]|uniref:CaiB/BaiF CoA transferase family protein n=1 Tax=Micromonospora sp. AMSO12t TaxID=2650410 RepID=UPI00124B6B2B|nr:CaiB/BaiF CoA-transferase family protein [Micromonospora sp. AMSO12t]KAB1152419.1 CoA transferase [Micromonospora sp. AMSO12t]
MSAAPGPVTGPRSEGPLAGLRLVELGGQGPVPFATMMLADLGAQVVRVDPPGEPDRRERAQVNAIDRGRTTVTLDLKSEADRRLVHRLLADADVLLDPFRPGVLERLGLDPAELTERNPRLVVARMTGWGQDGPLASAAGHDLNYIAVSGVLDTIGLPEQGPVVPPMYLADFAGGGMVLAFGVLAALHERVSSGRGQVVDSSMLEGSGLLTVVIRSMLGRGAWNLTRGTNYLDGGAHFYRVYRTADDRFMSVAAIEAKFYRTFLLTLGLDPEDGPGQFDESGWAGWAGRIAQVFAGRTRQEWTGVFGSVDACVHPVLDVAESAGHPQVRARRAVVEVEGVAQPAPVPRFSRTPAGIPRAPRRRGEDTDRVRSALAGASPWEALSRP